MANILSQLLKVNAQSSAVTELSSSSVYRRATSETDINNNSVKAHYVRFCLDDEKVWNQKGNHVCIQDGSSLSVISVDDLVDNFCRILTEAGFKKKQDLYVPFSDHYRYYASLSNTSMVMHA